jgi:hypothetical protein
VSGELHAPAALPPEERAPGTQKRGGWVDPRTGLDDANKNKYVACRYNDFQGTVTSFPHSLHTEYRIDTTKRA